MAILNEYQHLPDQDDFNKRIWTLTIPGPPWDIQLTWQHDQDTMPTIHINGSHIFVLTIDEAKQLITDINTSNMDPTYRDYIADHIQDHLDCGGFPIRL